MIIKCGPGMYWSPYVAITDGIDGIFSAVDVYYFDDGLRFGIVPDGQPINAAAACREVFAGGQLPLFTLEAHHRVLAIAAQPYSCNMMIVIMCEPSRWNTAERRLTVDITQGLAWRRRP